tara:strand:- start:214 stop:984 length:771 start_codon:yes stop_codon:yes gene_type:complete
MTKHNIFKDFIIYVGRVTCVWLTSAAKAPKMWTGSKFEKVPARTPVAVLTTLCGKEIRFSMFAHDGHQGYNNVLDLRLPSSTSVNFWKWEEGNEQSGLITVKLHNVWYPKNNPNKGYATQMPNDAINPQTHWIDLSDVEDLESKSVHQIQRESSNFNVPLKSYPKLEIKYTAPTCCKQCHQKTFATENWGWGNSGAEVYTNKLQNISWRKAGNGETQYTIKKKASIANQQIEDVKFDPSKSRVTATGRVLNELQNS